MSFRTNSFFATYTSGVSKLFESTYYVPIGWYSAFSTVIKGVYSWSFSNLEDQFNDSIISDITNSSITKMQLSFKYNNNYEVSKVQIFKYDGGDPSVESSATITANISSAELAAVSTVSSTKSAITVTLEDVDNLYYDTHMRISERTPVSLIIMVDTTFSTTGHVDIAGQTLVAGGSEWRTATASEPLDAPLLILTYNVGTETNPTLNMKYTTSDPTTDQSVPKNSIGMYVAPNDVYPSSPIKESINSVQTTIPIDLSSDLPTVIGLASVGPEVFKYSIIDTTNHQLSSVVRGISPQSSFPAGFDSFQNAERVYYLNDTNLLFDTRPSSGLVQYRCVAIINSDTGDDFNIKNASIGIAQHRDSDVQVRIGVELPKFDSRTGTAVDGTNNTSSTLLVTTIIEDDGFFDGALVKFLDPVEYAVVESYAVVWVAVDSGYGEFILSESISGLVATRNFVIMPAPAQSIATDATSPVSNSGRFTGFQENTDGINVSLIEHGTTMQENDLFYVWIKRTLKSNVSATADTGAVLLFRYEDTI